jgi:hypothetical protein
MAGTKIPSPAPLLCLTFSCLVAACSESSTWQPPVADRALADLPAADSSVDHPADHLADHLAPKEASVDLAAVDQLPKDTRGEASRDPAVIGCADGTREGFLNYIKFPKIAACGGAWSVKGVHNVTPACSRAAGNDGTNKAGTGCNVTDLCASGWHVCFGKVDVLSRNALGCVNIMDGAKSPAFFLARTSSTGAFDCSQDSTLFGGPGTSNDIFGCGDLGCPMVQGTCATGTDNCDPLKDCKTCPTGYKCLNGSSCTAGTCYPLTTGSHDLCKGLRNDGGCGSWCNHLGKYTSLSNTWDCGTDTTQEANNVIKDDPDTQGGVLCCQN